MVTRQVLLVVQAAVVVAVTGLSTTAVLVHQDKVKTAVKAGHKTGAAAVAAAVRTVAAVAQKVVTDRPAVKVG